MTPLRAILPPAVAVREAFGEPAPATLLEAEEEAIAGAVERRRSEFAAVRACARAALADLGIAAVPILPGEGGAPGWPAGVVGSMTHCMGYRAAAVARDSDATAIGIDAEPHEPLPDGVLRRVALEDEAAELAELRAGSGEVHWDRVLFAAKEAVYKAWFPLTRRWLGFHDARIELDPSTGSFSTRLPVQGMVFRGGWAVDDGIAVAAVMLGAR